jgi:hypothetical protein
MLRFFGHENQGFSGQELPQQFFGLKSSLEIFNKFIID